MLALKASQKKLLIGASIGLLVSWHAVAKIMTAAVTEVLFFHVSSFKGLSIVYALANEQPSY
jgi:hypothetical protein